MDADLVSLRAALEGQFRVEHEIGRGGMGVVYRAQDLKLDRAVAIKTLPTALSADPTVRERFLREARTAAKLTHPNIVPVYRADDAGDIAYIVMAFIDGQTLATMAPLAPGQAVPLLIDAARALGYAHSRGVIHRDIKPENILVDRTTGRAIVTDFGIARATITGDTTTPLTSTGQVMGTTQFMSPEQATGEPLDGRSDLYSLGVVAYYLLSGHAPFDGSPNAILVAHVTRTPPPLTGVPPALAAVIDQCLAKSPADRPATGEALADALAKALIEPDALPKAVVEPDALANAVVEPDALANAVVEPDTVGLRSRAATPQAGAAGQQVRAEPAPSASARLAEPDAARVWNRAAALQAGATGQQVRAELQPSESYSLAQVENAAKDAGIDPTYLALARSELAVDRAAGHTDTPSRFDRIGAFLLGVPPEALSASIVIPATVDRVFAAVGRVLHDAPYGLDLVDAISGILIFALPAAGSLNARTWAYTAPQVRHLRVVMRATPDGASTELTMYAEVRHPTRGMVGATLYIDACGGAAGTALGVTVATKLAIAGLALAGAAAAVAIPITIGVAAGMRAIWHLNRRGVVREMRRALDSVRAMLRTTDVFGPSDH